MITKSNKITGLKEVLCENKEERTGNGESEQYQYRKAAEAQLAAIHFTFACAGWTDFIFLRSNVWNSAGVSGL